MRVNEYTRPKLKKKIEHHFSILLKYVFIFLFLTESNLFGILCRHQKSIKYSAPATYPDKIALELPNERNKFPVQLSDAKKSIIDVYIFNCTRKSPNLFIAAVISLIQFHE